MKDYQNIICKTQISQIFILKLFGPALEFAEEGHLENASKTLQIK